ncbi:MAG: TolC family protein, partial [Rhizobiaceae bacterium]
MRICHRFLSALRGRACVRLMVAGGLTCSLVASTVFADITVTHGIRGTLNEGRTIPHPTSLGNLTLRRSVFDLFGLRDTGLARSTLRSALHHDVRQTGGADGLRKSIDATIRSSDKLRAGLHDSNAAQYRLQAARASRLPTITASTSFENTRNQDEFLTSRSSTDGRRHTASINVSMPIFSSGRIYYGIKSAKHAA